ncbi:MAG: hypothetical protein AABY18_00385 [Candidatus Thermoplasmatota archaeon]
MLRVAASAALILLLSGCLAAAPAPAVTEASTDGDDVTVTATRVEALSHDVDSKGRIQAHACEMGQLRGGVERCNGGSVIVAGIAWEVPVYDFADPLALFWRVSLAADWQSSSLVTGLRMTVYATMPCGVTCVELRKVDSVEDAASPGFDGLDVYLEPGETGLRVKLETIGYAETTWSEAAVHYHLHGVVNGYRPVGPPVVVA